MPLLRIAVLFTFSLISLEIIAQPPRGIHWSKDGNSYYESKDNQVVQTDPASSKSTVIVSKEQLTPAGASMPLPVRNFFFSDDGNRMLIYTNSKRVWRYDTRGDYWVIDITNHILKKLAAGRPESSLMFAKF